MLPINNGVLRQITIGGYTFDWDPANNSNDILLCAIVADGTTNMYRTPRASGATSGYQVPALKSLKLLAVDLIATNPYASQWGLGYGDTDVGLTSATPPTNLVSFNGGASLVCVTASAGMYIGRGGLGASVPAGKYVSATAAGSTSDRSSIQLYCKLV